MKTNDLDTPQATGNLVTVPDLARRWNVSRSWCYEHLNELPAIRVGGAVRFRESDLDAWLDRRTYHDIAPTREEVPA